MAQETRAILKNIDIPGYAGSLSDYEGRTGYRALRKVLTEMTPEQTVETVKASQLRGRGGAGFPTGLKWSFMAKNTGKPSYLICNADEGEPGTFKDRHIMLKDPHMFLEGMMIGCFAVNCHHGYIYVRGEFVEPIERLQHAIDELYRAGYLGKNIMGTDFDLNLTIHPGAGAYICGEETALLNSLEGERGEPRIKPPFPAVSGFNGCPTSVNNVETLTNLPFIFHEGVEAFQANGIPNNTGTRLVCLSGRVNRPGVYEVKIGENLKAIIDDLGGGVVNGGTLKGVIPGGSSSPVLLPDEIDISYDFDTLQKNGTMMGSCGIIALDDTVNIPAFLHRLVSFYNHESCGQCTPCREGMNWLRMMLRDMVAGKATKSDVNRVARVSEGIIGNTLCPLGDAGAMPTIAFMQKFEQEFYSLAA